MKLTDELASLLALYFVSGAYAVVTGEIIADFIYKLIKRKKSKKGE